jgi:hypothetical protein
MVPDALVTPAVPTVFSIAIHMLKFSNWMKDHDALSLENKNKRQKLESVKLYAMPLENSSTILPVVP